MADIPKDRQFSDENKRSVVVLLRAMAYSEIAKENKHDVILNVAAEMIERTMTHG